MSSQNQIIEKIQTAQHGKARPFRCMRYSGKNLIGYTDFATHQLAWASGEHWAGLNDIYSYKIIEKGKDD